MRKTALVPALWLALSGTAPIPPAPDALVECRMPREQAWAALGKLTLQADPMSSGAYTGYVIPPDLRAFGYLPMILASLHGKGEYEGDFAVMAIVRGTQPELQARALAAHGIAICDQHMTEPAVTCVVFSRDAGGWRSTMEVQDVGNGGVGIACHYFRTPG